MKNSATTRVALGMACLALTGCVSPRACYHDAGCGEPPVAAGGFPEPGIAGCADCGPTTASRGPGEAPELFPGRPLASLVDRVFSCNAGCGRVYYGEWQYDPPDSCDPCNNHGDFVGPTDCGPSCWQKFWEGIHGVRCDAGCVEGACVQGCYVEGTEPGFREGCMDGCSPGPAMESDIHYNDGVDQPSIMLEGESSEWDESSSPSLDSPPVDQTMPEPRPEGKSAGHVRNRSRLASSPRGRSCLVRPRNR